MEKQQNKIFANCSQTVRNHCEFRNELATSFALRNPIAPVHCTLAKFASHKTLAMPKFAMSSQTNFAMRKYSQCQIRNANFVMPISQCQFQFRNANTLFICLNLSEISHCEIRKLLCEIRKPISHCQLHQLCEIYICRPCHPL